MRKQYCTVDAVGNHRHVMEYPTDDYAYTFVSDECYWEVAPCPDCRRRECCYHQVAGPVEIWPQVKWPESYDSQAANSPGSPRPTEGAWPGEGGENDY